MTPKLTEKALAEICTHLSGLTNICLPEIETLAKSLWEQTLQDIEEIHKEYLAAKRSTNRAISQKIDLMDTGNFNDGYVQGRLAGIGVAPKTAEASTSTLYNLASK